MMFVHFTSLIRPRSVRLNVLAHGLAVALPVIVLALAALPTVAVAQSKLLDESEVAEAAGDVSRFGEPIIFQFRVGAVITARNGPCRDIRAVVAVPINCPEQTVRLIDEEITDQVEPLDSRELQGGAAKQMLISIPYLEGQEEARAILTFEIESRPTLEVPPTMADSLVIPRRVPKNMRRFVGPSPFIEAKSIKIKKLVRQVDADLEADLGADVKPTAWQQVEAYYDNVLDTIDYAEGPDTSALTSLKEEVADCHGRSALFVAMCRVAEVPSRMVWVHGHCYAEFYLEDPEGEGHWFPVESAGTRAFGEMPLVRDIPLHRAILQKGDNFRMPERPRERLRYATDYLTGKPVGGSGKPRVRYVREVVGEETK